MVSFVLALVLGTLLLAAPLRLKKGRWAAQTRKWLIVNEFSWCICQNILLGDQEPFNLFSSYKCYNQLVE